MLRSRSHRRRSIAISLSPWLALTVFAGWYARGGAPLTPAEVDGYLATIGSQTQQPGGRHDLAALRSFLESDDGQPFYIVNLYEFHDRAQYPEQRSPGRTGEEAFDRFSAVMIRLLAKHGSHPIFGSHWVALETSDWDRIVVVRYRSRRDLAEIFASQEFADAAAHKWAGIARNGRTLVQALHVPDLVIPGVALALLFGCVSISLGGRRGRAAARHAS